MLAYINKYINHIYYGLLLIYIAIITKIVLLNSDFNSYMHLQNKYGAILAMSNSVFIIALFFKQFLLEISTSKKTFIQFILDNTTLIFVNVAFFLLLITNGALEGKILSMLQHTHTNIAPIHIILYITTTYMGYSQYKGIFAKYNSLQNVTHAETYSKLIAITRSGLKELAVVAACAALSGKLNLATYIIHHINMAIILILGTSTAIFIALFILHSVKRYKQ